MTDEGNVEFESHGAIRSSERIVNDQICHPVERRKELSSLVTQVSLPSQRQSSLSRHKELKRSSLTLDGRESHAPRALDNRRYTYTLPVYKDM